MNNKIKLYVSKEENINEDLLYADNSTLISYFITAEDCSVETENCELKLLEDLLKEKYQAIRKQVCTKIRKFEIDNFIVATKNCSEEERNQAIGYDNCLKDLRRFIDQIEQGEK